MDGVDGWNWAGNSGEDCLGLGICLVEAPRRVKVRERAFWGDPLPVIRSTPKARTEASLSSKVAQRRTRKGTRC